MSVSHLPRIKDRAILESDATQSVPYKTPCSCRNQKAKSGPIRWHVPESHFFAGGVSEPEASNSPSSKATRSSSIVVKTSLKSAESSR